MHFHECVVYYHWEPELALYHRTQDRQQALPRILLYSELEARHIFGHQLQELSYIIIGNCPLINLLGIGNHATGQADRFHAQGHPVDLTLC